MNAAPKIKKSFLRTKIILSFTGLFVFFLTNVGYTQQLPCNTITAEMGYTVKNVEIKARWVPEFLQQQVEQLTGKGELFDPVTLNPAQNVIKEELLQSEGSIASQFVKGSMSVLYITSDVCDVTEPNGPREVQVTYRAWYLRVDLVNIGNNRLPVPRSARPIFYSGMPKIIQATSPIIGVSTDANYGLAAALQTATNFFANKDSGNTTKRNRFDLLVNLRKSLLHSFYTAGAALNFNRMFVGDSTMRWNVLASFAKQQDPLGALKSEATNAALQAGIQGSFNNSLLNKYSTGIGWRFLKSNFAETLDPGRFRSENGYDFFAIADGKPGKAFSRLGVWLDAAQPQNNSSAKAYQRFVSKLGYAISLGRNHGQVDIETQAGFGYTWGIAPVYNQFYAGNNQWNFLYEPLQSVRNKTIPTGPVMRSLGERAGAFLAALGTKGGGSFWNLNLNLSIPIKLLSRPLIPDVLMQEEPREITLRSALKSQSKTVENFIIEDLIENKGLPDDETTEAKAAAMVNRDIRPTLNYLADKANLYSLKPVLLFDMAGMKDQQNKYTNWLGAGLGLQLNIVVARFEAAYMHTIAPVAYNKKGNFFMRVTIQNFY